MRNIDDGVIALYPYDTFTSWYTQLMYTQMPFSALVKMTHYQMISGQWWLADKMLPVSYYICVGVDVGVFLGTH